MVNCAGCKALTCYKGEDCVFGHDFKAYDNLTRKEYEKADNNLIFLINATSGLVFTF